MMEGIAETSPRLKARIAGVLYLIIIVGGIFAEMFVRERLVVPRDPAATAANILAHEMLFRFGFAAHLIILLCALAVLSIFYQLLKRVNNNLAVLAFIFRMGEGMLAAIAPMATLAVLWLGALGTPDASGVETLSTFLLKIRGWNTTISAFLFAVGSTLFSYLFLRGRMIPVALAWLGVIASVLLVVSLPMQLAGVLHDAVTQLMWLPMAAFEIALALWLLIKGVAAPAPGTSV